jgi:hypothetical protein
VRGRGFGAVDDEHRLSVEIAGRDDRRACQRVRARHGDVVDGHAGEGRRGEPVGGDGAAHDPGGERPGTDAVEDPQRRQPVGADDHVGTGVVEAADGAHHRPLAAVAVADRQRRRRRSQFAGGSDEAIHRLDHGPRIAEQALAGRSQHDPAAGAFEEDDAERLLELADPLRERRRRHVQARRRPTEVTFLGDGDEVPQPSQVNRASHSVLRSRHILPARRLAARSLALTRSRSCGSSATDRNVSHRDMIRVGDGPGHRRRARST